MAEVALDPGTHLAHRHRTLLDRHHIDDRPEAAPVPSRLKEGEIGRPRRQDARSLSAPRTVSRAFGGFE